MSEIYLEMNRLCLPDTYNTNNTKVHHIPITFKYTFTQQKTKTKKIKTKKWYFSSHIFSYQVWVTLELWHDDTCCSKTLINTQQCRPSQRRGRSSEIYLKMGTITEEKEYIKLALMGKTFLMRIASQLLSFFM